MECQAGKAMIQEVKKAIERMHRLTGMPRSEIVSASGGDAELQHQLGHVLGAVIDVRFTPDATKLLRSSEMTRCAMCGRLRVGKENLHVAALVGAAMCSAYVRG